MSDSAIERLVEFDLRSSWQARALMHTRGKMAAVVLSVIAHNHDEQLLPLLRIVFPGFVSISAPFFVTAAKISRLGRVYVDIRQRDGSITREVIYETEADLQKAFRTLADRLKLRDAARIEMFLAVRRWIVCDYRIDPSTGEKERATA